MKRVVVIGAGASGIIASIFASKNNEVIVLERNTSSLKKLLFSGGYPHELQQEDRSRHWRSR